MGRYEALANRHEGPTMYRARPVCSLLLTAGLLAAPAAPAAGEGGRAVRLFNGKDLTNFYTFLKGYGKNNDPKQVFTVHDGMVHVTGEVFGCFTTEKEFENYHLVVEFKWGPKTYPPRADRARDSGVLVHSTGADGAYGGAW